MAISAEECEVMDQAMTEALIHLTNITDFVSCPQS